MTWRQCRKICMSCGCGMPYNDHNDYNNITYNSLLRAMIAGNVSTIDKLIENIESCYSGMAPTESADEGVNNDMGADGMAQPSYQEKYMTFDVLPGIEEESPNLVRLRDLHKHFNLDARLLAKGILDPLGFQNGFKLARNPIEATFTRIVPDGQKIDKDLLVKDPRFFTDPVKVKGVWLDRAYNMSRRELTAIRRTKNLRVTMGRDQWQRALMMGDIGSQVGDGKVGTLTSIAGTTATDSGASFPTGTSSAGNTGLQGKIIVVGPNASGTGSQVFGVIVSNTGTAVTVDQWYAVPVTGAAGTTPNATGKYTILPGMSWAAWVGLSTNASAAAAGDILRTADGLFGDGTGGGAATEQNANGLARAYLGQGGSTAPTYGSGTYVLAHTWTYTAGSTVTLQKVVMCNTLAVAGSLLFLETLLSAPGTVNANGDTITVTWTVTL